MKCTKCGYVSFDYLSECKKCGIDLTTAREALGFQTVKSNVPFFLGSLLKDHVKPSATGEEHLTEKSPGSHFDFGEDFDMGGSLDDVAPEVETVAMQAAPSAAAPAPAEADDFNLLDISDEELGILTMDEETERASGKGPGTAALSEGGTESSTLIPTVDVSSLPGLTRDSMGKSSGSGVSLEKTPVQAEGSIDENLVIDLSDKDLENFLSELEDSPEQEKASENSRTAISLEKR
jgi:hypothetical protein